MRIRIVASLLFCLIVAMLSACESYDFTVNERVVYTPAPLFAAFDVPDSALQACLEQAILDNKVTSPEQLTTLSCSHAGIASVQGLTLFKGLKILKLSSNLVQDITPLADLTALENIYLDDNRVHSATVLLQLPALQYLDLRGNTSMQCPPTDQVISLASLELPEHCAK